MQRNLSERAAHAEEALRQREVELCEAQRLAHIGSWYWKAESDVTVGSDELLRIFGLDPATQRVPTLRDQRDRWFPVDDWKRLKAAVQRTMQTGVGYELELQAFRNEIPIWITARGAAVRNSKGQIVGLRGTVQDVTERKQAELALAEQNLQLRLAEEAGLVGSYTYDTHTEIGQISPGYAAIHGYSDGTTEITRSEWLAHVHPEDVERLQLLRSKALRERRGEYKVDYRIVRRDGEIRWIESRVFIFYDSDSSAHRLNRVNIAVTESGRTEALITESKARLADALAAGHVMAFEWDALTGISQRSDNSPLILGDEQGWVAGSRGNSFLKQVHADDRERFRTHIRQLSARNASYALNFRFVRPDGETVWLEETAKAEFDATGRLLRIKGLTRDITDRKRVEEQQRVLLAELDHRVKNTLATVSAVVSHTLNASGSMTDFATALDGRIQSMARAHELLSASRWQGISVAELAQREMAPYTTRGNTEIDGPEVILKSGAGQVMAMVLHELATNAVKYGALSAQNGRVSI